MAHKIKTAYDAYHFLVEHPSFQVNERAEVDAAKADEMMEKGFVITKDRDGTRWREFRHVHIRAMDMNLNIHYAKVDGRGVVNGDRERNHIIECWLEFGPLEYNYHWDGDVETHLHLIHDVDLDTGAHTFDEALVKLARLVMKKYGDYVAPKREDDCGSPVCADCAEYEESDVAKQIEAR